MVGGKRTRLMCVRSVASEAEVWSDVVAGGVEGIDLRAWSHQWGGVDMSGGRTQPHETIQRSDTTVWTNPMTTPSHVSFPKVTYRAGGGISVAHMRAHVGARYAVAILASVLNCSLRSHSAHPQLSPRQGRGGVRHEL